MVIEFNRNSHFGEGGSKPARLDESCGSAGYLQACGFDEREIWRQMREFGDVAFVVSGYEMQTSPDGELIARAVKSIQLYRQDDRWRISAMLWRREGRSVRIPEEAPAAQ